MALLVGLELAQIEAGTNLPEESFPSLDRR
jgi:hypothetical protein